MLVRLRNFFRLLAVALWMAGVAMTVVKAEENDDPTFHTLFQPTIVNDTWKQECSVCHIAFPPGLLQAESWLQIMDSLNDHFGVDASLSDREKKGITVFLVSNAATRWRMAVPPKRISETTWFKNKHYIHERAWSAPLVKSAANCFACHKHAEHGDFHGGGGGCGGAALCHAF